MKISLVIPTRTRAEYLRFCLKSAIDAASRCEYPVEIVVSDNASEDATPEVVAAFNTPIIKYVRQAKRLSMRRNFEAALDVSTGTHVIFIGDDDAVLPHGLRVLGRLIAAEESEIYKWRVPNFLWPNPLTGVLGKLSIRPLKLTGRMFRLDPADVLQRFAAAKHKSYHEGGMIYHGCVARTLIDRIRSQRDGVYFWGAAPDVFAALANVIETSLPIMNIDLPITLGGASPRSNGASSYAYGKSGKIPDGSELSSFVAELEDDDCLTAFPPTCPSLELLTLDALMFSLSGKPTSALIDRRRWRARVTKEIASFAPNVRNSSMGHLLNLLGEEAAHVANSPQLTLSEPERFGRATVEATRAPGPPRVRNRLTHLTILGGAHVEDVGRAAHFLDDLVDLRSFYDTDTMNVLARVRRTLRIVTSVKSLSGRNLIPLDRL